MTMIQIARVAHYTIAELSMQLCDAYLAHMIRNYHKTAPKSVDPRKVRKFYSPKTSSYTVA